MLHVQFNGNEAENTMQVHILPLYTSTAPRHFYEVGHEAYYTRLKGKTYRTLCKFDLVHTPIGQTLKLCS